MARENELIAPDSPDFFYTDAISGQAAGFVETHARQDADRPFFLYVAYTAAHWPMHARPQNIAKYQGVYDDGWDAVRRQRYQRMLQQGLIRDCWQLSPRDARVPAWEEEERQEWNRRCMEVYAAMVDCMDQGIGRIVQSLRASGQLQNTLVLFLQDNGGCAEGMGRGKEISYRVDDPDQIVPMRPEELQMDMIPKRTRDGRAVRQGQAVLPGPADTYLGYGLPWANVSNTPFREYKHWVHEGGISTPLIAHWPAGIPRARWGQLESQPGHLIDVMATCVDLAGAAYPAGDRGQPITPLEGVSLQPAFRGQNLKRPNPIFWEHEGNRAVRQGKWKLVAKGAQGAWQLYDLEQDRSEIHDLAAQYPARVQTLADAWQAWARRANVIPWPWKGPFAAPKPAAAKSEP